jgi:EmrB/QacA subfamily drug resistance transporter
MPQSSDRAPLDVDRTARPLSRAVKYLVAGALFMEMLDGTVIATALPQMGVSFGVSAVELNIGMTAYLLTLAVFVPISGWVADRFGARTVFGGAILLFTAASVLCGLSDGLWSFIGARVLQGIGGAAMVPVGRLIVLRGTDKKDMMAAISTIVWPGLIAPVLGPPLGGFIVTYASWRWIFFLNLPIGLAAFIAVVFLVPNLRSSERRPLDGLGFLLCGLSLSLLIYGADRLGAGSRMREAFGLIAGGLVAGALAIRHLLRHPSPLLDLSVLRLPTYALGVRGGSLARIAIGAAPFLLPLMFQIGFGLSAFAAGLLVLCVFLGNLTMKSMTTPILRRFGFRSVLIVNGLLNAAALAVCGLFTPATPTWLMAVVLFASGAFRSMQFTGVATIQFADVPSDQMSGANTLASMVLQLTMGVGVVVGALALDASGLVRGRGHGAPDLTDFRNAFLVVALIALLALVDSLSLEKTAGRTVSGHGGG